MAITQDSGTLYSQLSVGFSGVVTNASFAHQDFTNLSKCSRHKEDVIALTLHANFILFIDQLDNTFFLTLFPLPQDFHDIHEIPEEHIHFSDIQQTPTTNPRSGNLQVHYRAGLTTRLSTQPLWELPLPDPSATLSETSPPQPPDWSESL